MESLSSDGQYCTKSFFSNGVRILLDKFLTKGFGLSDSSVIRLSCGVTFLSECIRMIMQFKVLLKVYLVYLK